MKIWFMMKLRADHKQVMLATIQFRIFCLLVCYMKIKVHKTVILPVVLYGWESWSLTFMEKHREQGAEEDIWT
jgi:hypothetical protein